MSLSNTLVPVVARLMGQFGFNGQFFSPARVRQSDGSTLENWLAIDVPELPVRISEVTAEIVLRDWGQGVKATAVGTVPLPAGVVIVDGMGLTMRSGPRTGLSYVVQRVKIDDVTRLATLALLSWPKAIEEAP